MASPTHDSLWAQWMKLLRKVGEFQSKLVLTLTFYLIFTPYALVGKLFGKDPLGTKRRGESYLLDKSEQRKEEDYYKQY
jgi:hypothetical protein